MARESMLQRGTKPRLVEKAVPHLPFQEFQVPSLDELLGILEKYKVQGGDIQVIESESAHGYCQKQLVHVLVPIDHYPVSRNVYREVEVLYQYCPSCKLAVRVL